MKEGSEMKKWNWRSFFAGSITTTLIFGCGATAFASNYMLERISFNSVKIGTPTATITNENNSYTLQNGEFVPYSIVYTGSNGGGTVYLPIRKISELTQTGIEWDGANNKVVIDADTTAAYKNMTGSYSDGYSDGYNDALSNNSTSSSYNSGYNAGYDDGYDDGKKVNSTNGSYQTGYNDGYTAGYNAGKGSSSGNTTDRYQEGYDAGFAAGKAQGVTEGEKSGYDKGFAEGEESGYQEGYEDGYEDGKANLPENPGSGGEDPDNPDTDFDRDSVSEEDMLNYLNANVPQQVVTPLGTYTFKITVVKNTQSSLPYDFFIQTSQPESPTWYDFKYSLDLDKADVEETLSIFEKYQETIYNAASQCAPNAKIRGGFYSSWYKYPSINEGFESMRVFSWKNYDSPMGDFGDYANSYYSGFSWNTQYDDYIF